ncbi:MAG: transcription termination/antitermination protein NusG [Ekhidna sp.]|nr:transcription termination/antitermination protein NusG [Ekhidna sp.]
MEHKWYVVRAVSGKERRVKEAIENEIVRQKLADYIPQVLIPSEKVFEMRNGKKRVREKSFFPGYILIQADFSNGEVQHLVTNKDLIPNVIGFLSATGTSTTKNPLPLRQSEVNRILGRVDEAEEYEEELDTPFIVGESVKVMDGPFSGFTGTVEEVFKERKKLDVTVKIFGRNTPIELNYTQVEKKD